MRNMVSSVTGLQKLRQLHEVLHSGHGDLTLLIKKSQKDKSKANKIDLERDSKAK